MEVLLWRVSASIVVVVQEQTVAKYTFYISYTDSLAIQILWLYGVCFSYTGFCVLLGHTIFGQPYASSYIQ